MDLESGELSHLSLHVWTGAWIIELTTVARTLSDATTTGSVKLSLLKSTRQCPSHNDVSQAIVTPRSLVVRRMCTPVMPEEFYPSVPSPLFCWVCGCSLGYTQRIRGHPAPFVFEMKKWQLAWKRHRRNRKYYRDIFGIHLAASELDRAFHSQDLYGDLFRLSRFPPCYISLAP
jgi:hypothetical protein